MEDPNLFWYMVTDLNPDDVLDGVNDIAICPEEKLEGWNEPAPEVMPGEKEPDLSESIAREIWEAYAATKEPEQDFIMAALVIEAKYCDLGIHPLDDQVNPHVFSREYKHFLESQRLIHCSHCGYHQQENAISPPRHTSWKLKGSRPNQGNFIRAKTRDIAHALYQEYEALTFKEKEF